MSGMSGNEPVSESALQAACARVEPFQQAIGQRPEVQAIGSGESGNGIG
jgi:hypothetical protein